MEFWKCLNEGKSLFLPEELELPVEVVVNTRNKVSGQDEETHYDTSNCPFASSLESNGGQELIQFGFPDTLGRIRQGNCSDLSRDVLRNQIGLDCYTEVASPTRGLSDVVSQEKQMGSRMPSLFVGSDCLELPTVDLKLGGLTHSVGARDGESSKSAASVHSSMPAVPTKRSRLASAYSQTPVCQVHGCNKDLSSYKDYYKRHKVCDAHTKTTKVIVKGIEQRFCQQCSRFHLLSEFDDGKRSCRKRLANHNERRRKSPGTRFLRSSSIKTSFLFQEMLPTATSSSSKHEAAKWFSHMKYEDPTLDSNLLLNFHDNFSAGTVDKGAGIAVPNEQDFAHIPDSSCALSLLSAQSLNPSDQLLGTAMSNPSVSTISHQNYSSAQGLTYSSTKNSENIGPSGFHSPAKAGPTTTVSSGGVQDDSILFGSNTSNNKYNLSSGQGTVVDLLQLSSHLQMVEHKRNLMH